MFCTSEILIVLEELLVQGFNVIAAGVNFDSEKRWFGSMKEIEGMADEVIHLTADCDGCGGDATHSYAKARKKEVVLDGAKTEYGAACGDCYDQLHVR